MTTKMSSVKSCPSLVECCHPLSHQNMKQHRDKYGNDDDLLELYLQSQMDIVTQERLLDDYSKTELQSIIPLDLINGNDLIMSSSITNTHYSFEDYTRDKSALIMKGLEGSLIPYVFNHPIQQQVKKKHRYSSMFSSRRQQEEQLVAFRYPKTVDIHTLRSFTIRLLIRLSPPYLSKKHVP